MSSPTATWSTDVRLRRLSVSPLAVYLAVLALLGLIVGWVASWRELLAGAIVAIIGISVSALYTAGRSHYAVALSLADTTVRVGQRAIGQVDVTNIGKRRLMPARIEMPVGRRSAEFSLPSLGPGETHDEIFAIPTKRRAVITVGPVSSVRADALGLIRREIVWTTPHDLYVHPMTIPLTTQMAGILRDLEGQTRKTISDNDMSFHALREYVPGDDVRNIHWKSSARNQSLMVRQYEDTRRTTTVLGVDEDAASWATEDDFELGVSVAASIAVHAIRHGLELTVLSHTHTLRTTTPKALLNDSCRLETTATPTEWITRTMVREEPTATLAFVITGAQQSPTELRERLALFDPGMRIVVVECSVDAQPSVTHRDQLTVIRLATMTDLPRTLALAVAR
ncbi:DUF58 domain-containing protein [Jonesia denitrificans]|uniref:DUF58 domain-containing protein n=1 Tax=Jonesia denitrificans (strain ATCC 14870 / DSM 20603 / BCRC 15368 / CIP 55.134 / JCM 11481 / NBRC 15587 / NCTC 10816 / Prevot 55134) TaxID=471856 RepID=C7R067_JONDD|nr:DUF58 domain-containing protein [Jonesia denitrificans]ACV08126.1 protein of unknown function DUF58 [Jonesia denitrificans DSM 20603]QXB42797.1 DUF58 domain-containing protein [Jonesia denitrificans]SQH20107.1 Uncharacterized conserved protein (some members contain a von Willebrand factor type A (vWA) domain) [Jonesia denitrificans]